MARITVANAILKLQRQLVDTNATKWTADAEFYDYLNEAVRTLIHNSDQESQDLWLRSADCSTSSINIVADTPGHTIPAGMYKMFGVWVTDSLGEVIPYPQLPTRQFHMAGEYGYTLGPTLLYLHPTPKVAVTSGLILAYTDVPVDVDDDADNVEFSDVFEDRILSYCLAIATAREDQSFEEFMGRYAQLQGPPRKEDKAEWPQSQ